MSTKNIRIAHIFSASLLLIVATTLFLLSSSNVLAGLLSGNTSSCCVTTSSFSNALNSAVSSGSGQNTINNVTTFSSGNSSWSVGNNCSGCTANTSFYSNGNGTYNTIVTYSEPSSSSGGSGGSSGGGGYSQGAYFSCPAGSRVFKGNSCCPNKDYKVVDTNGSKKGGKVEQCNTSSNPTPSTPTPSTPTPSTPSTPSSCTVNGTTVANGSSYTFYTTQSVPYGSTCTSVTRTCVNGQFNGDSSTYSRCTVGDAPDITGISIEANPPLVRYGDDTTIIWNGGNSEACTVKGWSLDSTALSDAQAVSGVKGESTYTLTCTLGPNTATDSTTVKILPRLQET